MANFKEHFVNDFEKVFLNIDEFATDHVINGVTIRCVLDTRESLDMALQNRLSEINFDGSYTNQIDLFCKQADLGCLPTTNGKMVIDNTMYLVKHCWDLFGVLQIKLEASL